MRYTIVVEQGLDSYGASVADLPGSEAVEFHLATMREEELAIPEPSSMAESVEIAAA